MINSSCLTIPVCCPIIISARTSSASEALDAAAPTSPPKSSDQRLEDCTLSNHDPLVWNWMFTC